MKKIKFIKEFRVINVNIKDTGLDTTIEAGEINDFVNDESAQWLIDNGFAEEVKESGWWKPELDDKYYFVDNNGDIEASWYDGGVVDTDRFAIGNCFKTRYAAERYRDYLKAIATVRQDKGVLTPEQAAKNGCVYYISSHSVRGVEVHGFDVNYNYMPVNTLPFDTEAHAQVSLDEHSDEWKIITNYDWSRE